MPAPLIKGTVQKGVASVFKITKADLALLVIDNTSYFTDPDNWETVVLSYKNSGGQTKAVIMRSISATEFQGNFFVTAKAKSDYEIQSVTIIDPENLGHQIKRDDLITSDWDIVFPAVDGSVSLLWTKFNPATLNSYGTQGGLQNNINEVFSTGWANGAYSSELSGNFTIEYEVEKTAINAQAMIGYSKSIPTQGVYPAKNLYLESDGLRVWTTGGSSAWDNDIVRPLINIGTIYKFKIFRLVSTIYYEISSSSFTTLSGIIESNYSGPIFPHAILFDDVGNDSARLNKAVIINPAFSSFINWDVVAPNVIESSNGGLERVPLSVAGWNNSGYLSTPVAAGVDFTLTFNVQENSLLSYEPNAMFGFSATNPSSQVLVEYGFYPRGGNSGTSATGTNIRFGGANTVYSPVRNITGFVLVIERINGVVTFKQDGVLIHTGNYNGIAYPHVDLYDEKTRLVSATKGVPVATNGAYRYYKMEVYNSYPLASDTVPTTNIATLADVKFVWDGVSQDMTTHIFYDVSTNELRPTLHDGIIPTNNTDFSQEPLNGGLAVDFWKVDLTTPRVVTNFLLAPQNAGVGQVYNAPAKFKIIASNNANFSDAKVVLDSDGAVNSGWVAGAYKTYPSTPEVNAYLLATLTGANVGFTGNAINVGGKIRISGGTSEISFNLVAAQNGSGAYHIRAYVESNTLAGSGGTLKPLIHATSNDPINNPENALAESILKANFISGSGTGGLFRLESDLAGYTGDLTITKIELYQYYKS